MTKKWILDFYPRASSAFIELCVKCELVNNGFDLSLPIHRFEDLEKNESVFQQRCQLKGGRNEKTKM